MTQQILRTAFSLYTCLIWHLPNKESDTQGGGSLLIFTVVCQALATDHFLDPRSAIGDILHVCVYM